MKRYFYLWHRWLGIFIGLFMALWFISGVVMMYVGYPKLTPREHLAHLPELQLNRCCVDLTQVLQAVGPGKAPQSIRLSMVAGEPRYLLSYPGQANVAVDARTGMRVQATSEAHALASARQFDSSATAQGRGLVQEDVWTLSRALDADRPLQRVELADAEQRLLYVSGQTGEVVRDATAQERAWNWVGTWLHWLYPLRGIGLDGAWRQIVIYLSLAASLTTLLGLMVGILRWRFQRPYRSGSRSPYKGFARWHHLGGLLFGVLAITWIFSGLMSMNPWKLFSSDQPLSVAAYQGGALSAEAFPIAAEDALPHFERDGLTARELEWRLIAGKGYLIAYDGAGQTRVLSMSDAKVSGQFSQSLLEQAARAIRPQGQMTVERLQAYDFYYYGRDEQSMLGHLQQRLPMLRLRLDDPAQTWLHLDLHTGAIVGQLDQPKRASRWLFSLLHSWDWLPLLANRLVWDAWMLVFSAGGLLISLTGVVLGYRRIRRSLRSKPSVPLSSRTSIKEAAQ